MALDAGELQGPDFAEGLPLEELDEGVPLLGHAGGEAVVVGIERTLPLAGRGVAPGGRFFGMHLALHNPMTSTLRIAALSVIFLSLASCGVGRHSPSEPAFSCDDIAGSYDATFSNSCGGSGSGIVLVAQAGCTFSALIPGFGGGSIAGQINGRSATFTLFFAAPCSGSATGTATVGRTAITGTYSGGATGFGCCNPVSGSFALTR